jgi:hypothetical protein
MLHLSFICSSTVEEDRLVPYPIYNIQKIFLLQYLHFLKNEIFVINFPKILNITFNYQ